MRKKNYRVVKRGLQRYELYVRATKRGQKKFVLNVDDVTSDTLRDIWDFFENEYIYCKEYPSIYESIPEARTPQPRGRNTLLDCFSRIRTFFYWCKDNKRTTNTPFDDFPLEECTYGTPYYITIDERNKIYRTNLSCHPQLNFTFTQAKYCIIFAFLKVFYYICIGICKTHLYGLRNNSTVG